MTRTVLQILSLPYSGSTLLSLLFDAQPGVRALGEAMHLALRSPQVACVRCNGPCTTCPLTEVVQQGPFYSSIFDYYDDQTSILVDASKSLSNSLAFHDPEPGLNHQAVILSKSPHEFAFSWRGHHADQSVHDAFQIYWRFYESELWAVTHSKVPLDHVHHVTYRDLVTQTDASLKTILASLFVHQQRLSELCWWETTSHLIGGNWLVTAQVSGFAEAIAKADARDRHRYQSHARQLFYDDAWRNDKTFVRECVEEYRRIDARQRQLLSLIDQPSIGEQIADLEDC